MWWAGAGAPNSPSDRQPRDKQTVARCIARAAGRCSIRKSQRVSRVAMWLPDNQEVTTSQPRGGMAAQTLRLRENITGAGEIGKHDGARALSTL